jgi:glycerol-3-phosphate acyltransferase PlsX
VKSGDADCIISAGNTGALLSSSLFLLGKINGIRRPAFAPYIPTDSGGLILCDAGANADARPQHLVQFALMASAYLEHVDQIPNPRVGLLNIGTEENKGNELTRTSYSLLKEHIDNFIGNVESRYMLSGGVDVLVCDGFTGNVALKLIEGLFKNVSHWLQSSVANTNEDDSIILSILADLKNKFDYEEYGGTPLLGINGIVMKCHGSSSKLSIRNTIQAVKKFHNENLIGDIADRLSKHMDIFDENTIISEAQTA